MSPSTEDDDRGDKFQKCRSIPTLMEYLIIEQDQAMVTITRRSDENTWQFEELTGLDGDIRLSFIGCSVTMNDVYFYIALV